MSLRKYIITFISLILIATAVFSCKSKPAPTPAPVPPSPIPTPSPAVPEKDTAEKTLRFAVMADSRGTDKGVNSEIVTKTLEEIEKLSPQPSFAIMPGDLISGASSYSETKAQLQHFKDIVTKYYPAEFYYPGFGNHEAVAGINGEQAFSEIFPEIKASFLQGYHNTVYYFDKDEYRFYMLNSNHPGEYEQISDRQLDWIKLNTDQSKKSNFYFFHEPAYPTGSHAGSSLDVQKLQRDKLWSVIDSSINPLAFCGHEHNYTRRHINSVFNETVNGQDFKFNKTVYQVTTGTFGAPIYKGLTDSRNVDVPPIMEYHYAIVDAAGTKIKVTVYNLSGKIIDSFEQQ